jgi:hypothetical protein
MGYVAAKAFDRSVHVRLRPAIATAGALRALLSWLRDKPMERVLISTLEDGWRHELMPMHQAMSYISAIAGSLRAAQGLSKGNDQFAPLETRGARS